MLWTGKGHEMKKCNRVPPWFSNTVRFYHINFLHYNWLLSIRRLDINCFSSLVLYYACLYIDVHCCCIIHCFCILYRKELNWNTEMCKGKNEKGCHKKHSSSLYFFSFPTSSCSFHHPPSPHRASGKSPLPENEQFLTSPR